MTKEINYQILRAFKILIARNLVCSDLLTSIVFCFFSFNFVQFLLLFHFTKTNLTTGRDAGTYFITWTVLAKPRLLASL